VRITREDAKRLGLDFDALWRAGSAVASRAVAIPGEPRLVRADSGPGWWEGEIVDWAPASKNLKVNHWKWYAARKRDNAAIGLWAVADAGPPAATEKRTVRLTVRRRRASGRLPDSINLMESFADSCVENRLLVDDSARWMAFPEPVVFVDKGIAAEWATTIRLEENA
jgi:hypothetical protein